MTDFQLTAALQLMNVSLNMLVNNPKYKDLFKYSPGCFHINKQLNDEKFVYSYFLICN